MLRTRMAALVAGSAVVLALSGTAAASASTHGRINVASVVTAPPESVSLSITSPGLSFDGTPGQTVKQQVTWTVNSTDPSGYAVTVQTGSNQFTDGRNSYPVGTAGWGLINTDNGIGDQVTPNMSTQPLTVDTGSAPTPAGGYSQEDFYKATIPQNAQPGTYFIPGGLFYEVIAK